jgi:putative lipoprotein
MRAATGDVALPPVETTPEQHQATARVLEAGAHPSAHNHGGWASLHIAVMTGNTQLAQQLLAAGASLSGPLMGGGTSAVDEAPAKAARCQSAMSAIVQLRCPADGNSLISRLRLAAWRRHVSTLGVATVVLLLPTEARADDPWWAPDKALHFGISTGLALGAYGLSTFIVEEPWQRSLIAGGASLSAGAAKELWDMSGHGDASWKDLTWDAAGTTLGVSIALSIDLAYDPSAQADEVRGRQ